MRQWLAAGLVFAVFPVAAQQEPAPTLDPQACVAITVDADRLACYDAAMKRDAPDTAAADQAANEARATRALIEPVRLRPMTPPDTRPAGVLR